MDYNIKLLLRFIKNKNINVFSNTNNEAKTLFIKEAKTLFIKEAKKTKNIIQLIGLLFKLTPIYANNNIENTIFKEKFIVDFENFYIKQKYNKTRKQIFDEFLKNNRAYKKFYKNIKICKPHNKRYEQGLTPLYLTINDAFTWDNTNEKFQFWSIMHEKLRNMYIDTYTQ